MVQFQNGDIALAYRPGLAAICQSIYAKKFREGSAIASHAFFFKDPDTISEADGFSIHESSFLKYHGVKIWVFRFSPLSASTLALMNIYVAASENGDARYSWSGIWDFVKSYFTGKRTFTNPQGEFCSDYTGEIIKAAGLPYISDLQPWEIDPTTQLSWFLSYQAFKLGWKQVL